MLSGILSQSLDGDLRDREWRLTEGEVGNRLASALQFFHLEGKYILVRVEQGRARYGES